MPKSPESVPVSPLPTQHSASPMDSFFADLAGLTLSDALTQTQAPSHTHVPNSHQPQYKSGILTPTSLNRTGAHYNENTSIQHIVQSTVTSSSPRTMASSKYFFKKRK
jgi:hypothetical protein